MKATSAVMVNPAIATYLFRSGVCIVAVELPSVISKGVTSQAATQEVLVGQVFWTAEMSWLAGVRFIVTNGQFLVSCNGKNSSAYFVIAFRMHVVIGVTRMRHSCA